MLIRMSVAIAVFAAAFYWLALGSGQVLRIPITQVNVAQGAVTEDGWIVFPANEEAAAQFRPDGKTRVIEWQGYNGGNILAAMAVSGAVGLAGGWFAGGWLSQVLASLSHGAWRRRLNRQMRRERSDPYVQGPREIETTIPAKAPMQLGSPGGRTVQPTG